MCVGGCITWLNIVSGMVQINVNLQLLKDLIERKMNFTETSDPIAMGRYACVCEWVCICGCACVSVGVGVFVYILASMCGCVYYVHMLVCVYICTCLYGCGCDGR